MTEIDETFHRLSQHPGVLGLLVVNSDGIPVKEWPVEEEAAMMMPQGGRTTESEGASMPSGRGGQKGLTQQQSSPFKALSPQLILSLAAKARHCVRELDPMSNLTFLRIQFKNREIMVAPDKDFTFIVLQKASQA